ncbi:unnamed protein product, partial [Meganyctiphanes norvegica]
MGHPNVTITTLPEERNFLHIVIALARTHRKHKALNLSIAGRFFVKRIRFSRVRFFDCFSSTLSGWQKVPKVQLSISEVLTSPAYSPSHYISSVARMNAARPPMPQQGASIMKMLTTGRQLHRNVQIVRANNRRDRPVSATLDPVMPDIQLLKCHHSGVDFATPSDANLFLTGMSYLRKFTKIVRDVFLAAKIYLSGPKNLATSQNKTENAKYVIVTFKDVFKRKFYQLIKKTLKYLYRVLKPVLFFFEYKHRVSGHFEYHMNVMDNFNEKITSSKFVGIKNKYDIKFLHDLTPGKEKPELHAAEHSNVREPLLKLSYLPYDWEVLACERLLSLRVDSKMRTKKADSILNRVHVALPVPRDNKERKPFIPNAVADKKVKDADPDKPRLKLEKDIMEEEMEDYTLDLNKNKDLDNDEWKYDKIPEMWEGKNIADFIDPDILKKLDELEAEEEAREQAGVYESLSEEDDDEMKEIRVTAKKIRHKKVINAINRRIDKSKGKVQPSRPGRKRERSVSRLRGEFEELGVDMSDTKDANFARNPSKSRSRPPLKKRRADSEGVVRSSSKAPRDKSGMRDPVLQKKMKKKGQEAQGEMNRDGRRGEGDRHVYDFKPKHLFAGKRGTGKTDRR